MSKVEIIAPFILSFEGGFVNDKDDMGGATNNGVTLNTWRKVGYDKDGDGDIDVDDLKMISNEDAVYKVLKPYYWDALRCDDIKDQSVANMLSDWAYNSGPLTAAKAVQRIVNVAVDGKIGQKTVAAINNHKNNKELFENLKKARLRFIDGIVERNSSQSKFHNGWKRRIDSIEYNSLRYNNGKVITF